MTFEINQWSVQLLIIEHGPLVTYGKLTVPRWTKFWTLFSRTIEWVDGEFEDATDKWLGYFEENAL